MTNIEQRSERIHRLMLIWAERTDADERNHADNVNSLLADLRLYCEEYGVDFDCALEGRSQ